MKRFRIVRDHNQVYVGECVYGYYKWLSVTILYSLIAVLFLGPNK